VIKTYRSKSLRLFAETGSTKKLPVKQVDRVRIILTLLETATHAREMDQPGLMFHSLHGGRYSVRVSGNYRITWRWQGADAYDVDIEDYH
jgi:proteic killer suppression protein